MSDKPLPDPPQKDDKSSHTTSPHGLISELKRRKVFRAAGTYLVVAWLILQVAAILLPAFEVPIWGIRLVFFMCALGFPMVVLIAWTFELSPEGMRRTPESTEVDESPPDAAQTRRRNWAAFALGAAVPSAGFLFLFIVVLLLRPDTEDEKAAPRISIAVLPFENLSANEEDAYFTAGVYEDLLTQLARLRELSVTSKSSVLRYGSHPKNLHEIATELDVAYVVEGSVQRMGDDVRIRVQLVDLNTNSHLWAENYDRRMDNLFALQSEISRTIAQTVQVRISPAEAILLERVPTTVVAAYDAYLKARNSIRGFWIGFDVLAEAEANLNFATQADPEFVEAWALLSVVHSRRYMQLFNTDQTNPEVPEASRKALASLEKAKALNPDHVATLRAQGFNAFVVTNDYLEGSRNLDKALSLVPNDTETLTLLAFCYRRLGQIEKAIEILEDLYEDNPDEPFVFYSLTSSLHDTAKYGRLIPIYEHALQMFPERKHFILKKLYYQFLTSGKLEDFRTYEQALNEIEITEGCDPAAWRIGRMTIAMLNGDFEDYARDWRVKWEEHHRDHGDWVCPLQVNEEANHAALLLLQGYESEAGEIIEESFQNINLPPNPMATCTFDTEMIRPKLHYMKNDPTKAREDLQNAMQKLNNKPDSLVKYIEKAVLLEAADMIAPDMAYPIFKDIQDDPVRIATLESICASPWTYPHLLANPDFQEEVRADGRFVDFLEHFGFMDVAS